MTRRKQILKRTIAGLVLINGCYGGPDGAIASTDGTTSATDDAIGTTVANSTAASTSGSGSGSSSGADAGSGSPGSVSDASSGAGADGSTAGGDGSDSTSADGSDMTADDGSSSGGITVDGCTAAELELIDLVNAYRADNGLPAIPASPSLCTVGHTHAVDLATNAPHEQAGCNLHSWSDAGAWTPCCYTSDHAQAGCMWLKPGELTAYPGAGYENAAYSSDGISPEEALDMWQSSPGHNAVILNQDIWADVAWGAVGAGIEQGYAVLWFGQETDPDA